MKLWLSVALVVVGMSAMAAPKDHNPKTGEESNQSRAEISAQDRERVAAAANACTVVRPDSSDALKSALVRR